MSSGRRETALIFCTSVVKNLYLPSVEHYDPDRIYVFTSNSDDALSKIDREIYKSAKKEMDCANITELPVDTSDYEKVLSAIFDIKKDLSARFGDNLDIFLNITSGTPEFAAAGMFASMLPPTATAFRVDAECRLPQAEMSEIIGILNNAVSVSEPAMVSILQNDGPDEEMIGFLMILKEVLGTTRYPRYHTLIEKLKERGIWSYDPEKKSNNGRTTLKQKEERYLTRHYISPALESGWIERPNANMFRITREGMAYLSVFGEAYESEYEDITDNILCEKCCSVEPCFDMIPPTWVHRPKDSVVQFGKDGEKHNFRISWE